MVPKTIGWMKKEEVGQVKASDLLHNHIWYVFGIYRNVYVLTFFYQKFNTWMNMW